jgi:hypothetical protein
MLLYYVHIMRTTTLLTTLLHILFFLSFFLFFLQHSSCIPHTICPALTAGLLLRPSPQELASSLPGPPKCWPSKANTLECQPWEGQLSKDDRQYVPVSCGMQPGWLLTSPSPRGCARADYRSSSQCCNAPSSELDLGL